MSAPLTKSGLTLQEERFCQAMLTQAEAKGSQSEAYKLAFNAHHWKANALAVAASRLRDKPKVQLRIAELAEDALAAAQVTPDWIVRLMAEESVSREPDASAHSRLRGLELLAKVRAMLVDRQEHIVTGEIVIHHVSFRERLGQVVEGEARALPAQGGPSEASEAV